ncbi:MAG: Fluoride ion transporter CrcB [uncultured Corynebacteriales bacterium]|uniref:Fluoride-specific ion channel FluC n=1 Tax=uncultured Mycobacteriales bacterium TaxID=581187 RepID=A0A6J4JKT2_9ACTN|nr:MAG: Fluoride ion transporter CrcB [uncultured Corynebacteriales bacterium]
MTALWVALGAAVGAPTRYLVDRAVRDRLGSAFPWGTFLVNVVGCLLLGLVAGSGTAPAAVVALVGTGFCGALTTYSTYGWEALVLAERGAWRAAAAYVLGSTAAGLGAAALGWTLVN